MSGPARLALVARAAVPARVVGSRPLRSARSLVRSLSIRWRLAALSAVITFVVLCAFALVIGEVTVNRVRGDFNREVDTASANLMTQLRGVTFDLGDPDPGIPQELVQSYALSNHAVIRIVTPTGSVLRQTPQAPNFAAMGLHPSESGTVGGYRVRTRGATLHPVNSDAIELTVYVQYARKIAGVEATVARVRLLLLFGVLAAAGVALALALALARRALAPIARLTATARDIEETRDPNRRVPMPDSDDEVAELARTLDAMLQALESSRAEAALSLARQRQFVADASHELRTPLTSVLANLELLADVLQGEAGEAAHSALRSTQRMRRLVGDLLLLARADAEREVPHTPTDLGQIVLDAAGELGPLAADHVLVVDATPVSVDGARDELHRLVLNLMENAVRHTPPGTHVRVRLLARDGTATLVVADDGPGVPPDLRDRVFERFVRAEGDSGGSVGLGLSIVRAVAHSHGGEVVLEQPPEGGTRFVVTLPALARDLEPAPQPEQQPA